MVKSGDYLKRHRSSKSGESYTNELGHKTLITILWCHLKVLWLGLPTIWPEKLKWTKRISVIIIGLGWLVLRYRTTLRGLHHNYSIDLIGGVWRISMALVMKLIRRLKSSAKRMACLGGTKKAIKQSIHTCVFSNSARRMTAKALGLLSSLCPQS